MQFPSLRRRTLVRFSVLVAFGCVFSTPAHRVFSDEFQPIRITADAELVAGQALPLAVETDGPATIHVYSDPPGVVTYDGPVTGTTATIEATTTTPATSGNVVVYLETDGEQVVSTTVSPAP